MEAVSSLTTALLQAGLEEFALDKAADFSSDSVGGRRNQSRGALLTSLYVGCMEAALTPVAAGEESANEAATARVLQLFTLHATLTMAITEGARHKAGDEKGAKKAKADKGGDKSAARKGGAARKLQLPLEQHLSSVAMLRVCDISKSPHAQFCASLTLLCAAVHHAGGQ